MSPTSINKESIYEEEKAREEARKRLQREENQRKNKKILIGLGAFIIVMIILVAISPNDKTSNRSSEGSSNSQLQLTDSQVNLINKLESEDYLRLEVKYNKAYVDRSLWDNMDAKVKKDFTVTLAIYCGAKKGNNLNYVDIYDKMSAKKLAKYNSWGFEVY
jgi:uncharacterized protein YpmS